MGRTRRGARARTGVAAAVAAAAIVSAATSGTAGAADVVGPAGATGAADVRMREEPCRPPAPHRPPGDDVVVQVRVDCPRYRATVTVATATVASVDRVGATGRVVVPAAPVRRPDLALTVRAVGSTCTRAAAGASPACGPSTDLVVDLVDGRRPGGDARPGAPGSAGPRVKVRHRAA